jgi:hypothetical protein
MTVIRYSDDDRQRMRRDKAAREAAARREALYVEFLCEKGLLPLADDRPISEETIRKIGTLDLRWRDRT